MDRYLKDEPKLLSMEKLPTDLASAWDLFTTPSSKISSWKMDLDALCLGEDSNDRHLDVISIGSSGLSVMSWESSLSSSLVVKDEPLDDYEDADLCSYNMDLLCKPYRGSKRLKRGRNTNDSNNNHACHSNFNSMKGDIKIRRNQGSNAVSGCQSDSSSSTHSSCSENRNLLSTSYQRQRCKRNAMALVQPKTETSIELKILGQSCSGSSSDESNDHLPILTPPSSPESIRNSTTIEAEQALLGHQGLIRVSSANSSIPRSSSLKCSTRSNGVRIPTPGLANIAITQRNANTPTSQASTSESLIRNIIIWRRS